jgi:hypothetical protein
VPVTETYYETEYRTETYTTTEYVAVNTKGGVVDLTPNKQWREILKDRTSILSPFTSYYGYNISTIQHSKQNIKIVYSYTGLLIPVSNFLPNGTGIVNGTALYIHNLTGIGQITLPTNFKFGKQGQWTNIDLEDIGLTGTYYNYIPTTQEQKWLEGYYSKVGTPDTPKLLLTPTTGQFTFYEDPNYIPRRNGLTTLGVALLGEIHKYNCSIVVDAQGVEDFAIITQTMKSDISSPLSTSIEIQSVQLIQLAIEEKTVTRERQVPYQVEKQRTVMQTKKVPFWEAIFH